MLELAGTTSWLHPPTVFPFHSLTVHGRLLRKRALQLLETLDRLREATIPFENVTNNPVNDKSRNPELNRRNVTIHVRSYRGMHTLAEALIASSDEPRINIVPAHLISTPFEVKRLSDNAVE